MKPWLSELTPLLSGVQYPFPKSLCLNFNKLPICFLLSHPRIPFCPKARKAERRSLRRTRAASSDGTEQVTSLPVADKVILFVLCSWTLLSLGAHHYSAIVCLSVCLSHSSDAQPCLRCYHGTCIPTLNAFSMRERKIAFTNSFLLPS